MIAAAQRNIDTSLVSEKYSVPFGDVAQLVWFGMQPLLRDVDDTGARMPSPTYTGLRMNMVWDQGTWKAREATGPAQFGPYNSLDGFTRWAL